jgi:hypothetical protein
MILKCLETLYKDKVTYPYGEDAMPEVTQVCVRRDFVTRLEIDPESILAVKEHFNDKGIIYKNRCLVNISGFGNLVVKHTFKEMVKLRNVNKDNFTVNGYSRQR